MSKPYSVKQQYFSKLELGNLVIHKAQGKWLETREKSMARLAAAFLLLTPLQMRAGPIVILLQHVRTLELPCDLTHRKLCGHNLITSQFVVGSIALSLHN